MKNKQKAATWYSVVYPVKCTNPSHRT